MMKTILFYYISEIAPTLGGVERVVSIQYNELIRRGYRVLTIHGKSLGRNDAIPNQYELPVPEQLDSLENIAYISDFVKRESVCIAFNFAAILNKSSLCLVRACQIEKIPLISVLHNTMDVILWSFPMLNKLMEHSLGKIFLHLLLAFVQRMPFYRGGRYLYNHSVATVVLAPCYVEEYKRIIGKSDHVFSIYNPLSLPVDKSLDWDRKENTVLFVGRLEKQKGLDKLIRIWSKVNVPDWKLFIVGKGSQEDYLKQLAQELGITNRISFEGHQDPVPYYRKSKIFCLTSIYEGYPMTLIECQAYGAVPMIYDSFIAARDIVRMGENGILVPAFQYQAYISELRQLMVDEERLKRMSDCCRREIDRYSVGNIMEQWVELIERYRL